MNLVALRPEASPGAAARLLEPFADLTSIGDGWSGEGSVSITASAWSRASEVVSRFLARLPNLAAEPNARFKLVPHEDGGLDVIWRAPAREWQLKVDIPAEPAEESGGPWYYTRSPGGLSEGDLAVTTSFEDAVSFLSNRTRIE